MRVRCLVRISAERTHEIGEVIVLADDNAERHIALGNVEPEGAKAEREAKEAKERVLEARKTVEAAEAAEREAKIAAEKAARDLGASRKEHGR